MFVSNSMFFIIILIQPFQAERYNIQQELEPNARAVLMRAMDRPLHKREATHLDNLLKLLRGHPIHSRIAHLVKKAKKAKLNAADMIQLRAMAGNGEPGEGRDDVDEDMEMEDVEGTDEKITLPLLRSIIGDLGAQAENSGAVLKMIQTHAKEGIQVRVLLALSLG
jgi:hypothetical protein